MSIHSFSSKSSTLFQLILHLLIFFFFSNESFVKEKPAIYYAFKAKQIIDILTKKDAGQVNKLF